MNAKIRKIAIILMAIVISLALLFGCMPSSFSMVNKWEIDLFTQKQPFKGAGPNATSDAFAPGEEVQVYAYVSYNGGVLSNMLVSFAGRGPANVVENITFFRIAVTNESGIAGISFRIPQAITQVFGNWTVKGNVLIDGTFVSDSLAFKVGWIVEITSLETMNENYVYSNQFSRNKYIVAQLGLRSIAMTNKTCTLTATVKDSLDQPVNSSELEGLVVPPTGATVFAYLPMLIPKNASIGQANVYASAYTMPVMLGGVAFCPEVSTQFLIVNHDVAVVNVKTSTNLIQRGKTVFINVTVENQGDEPESFPVTAYANKTEIDTFSVIDLQASTNTTVRFAWNTTTFEPGVYQISAFASPVPDEIDTSNNVFYDGFVQVTNQTQPPTHDIAILGVIPSANVVHIGDILRVDVIIKNKGTMTESFDVILYFGSNVAETIHLTGLLAGSLKVVNILWNTGGIAAGNYTMSASAVPVPGETNTADNYFKDGTVKLIQGTGSKCPPTWFYWFLLLLLLILIVILLILWFYYRSRKRKSVESFYSGWMAWYYCHNMKLATQRAKV